MEEPILCVTIFYQKWEMNVDYLIQTILIALDLLLMVKIDVFLLKPFPIQVFFLIDFTLY